MNRFIQRRPIWSFIIFVAIIALAWLIFAPWPPAFEAVFGKKKLFLNAILNGITLGGLYFLVASGFTLIFGLMRNVNLAHGSIYLLGGYFGYMTDRRDRLLAPQLRRRLRRRGSPRRRPSGRRVPPDGGAGSAPDAGDDRHFDRARRPDAVGLRGQFVSDPDAGHGCAGRWIFPSSPRSSRRARRSILSYPIVRLVIFVASVVIGLAMWLVLNRTRIGMIVRAGVDDREMLSAMGVPIQLVFVIVFAFGAGLAGMAGVVGGTFQSISPGEDTRFLLASLIVVIVGGMGSIPGAALGAVHHRARPSRSGSPTSRPMRSSSLF